MGSRSKMGDDRSYDRREIMRMEDVFENPGQVDFAKPNQYPIYSMGVLIDVANSFTKHQGLHLWATHPDPPPLSSHMGN